jgi:hypothetical protein
MVTADQIADIVFYLRSPAAAAINGTTIKVFGGLRCRARVDFLEQNGYFGGDSGSFHQSYD